MHSGASTASTGHGSLSARGLSHGSHEHPSKHSLDRPRIWNACYAPYKGSATTEIERFSLVAKLSRHVNPRVAIKPHNNVNPYSPFIFSISILPCTATLVCQRWLTATTQAMQQKR
jgi:hypothetical protein